jgi:hypothetical protein
VRLDELDTRGLGTEAVDQVVAAAPERRHHTAHLGIHALIGESMSGRPLRRMIGSGRGVRL